MEKTNKIENIKKNSVIDGHYIFKYKKEKKGYRGKVYRLDTSFFFSEKEDLGKFLNKFKEKII